MPTGSLLASGSRCPRAASCSPVHSRDDSFTAQLLLRVRHFQCFDEAPDVTFHDRRKVMQSHVDAMVGDSALREVICADFGRSIAGADLSFPHSRSIGLLLGDAPVEEARAQDLHRFGLVLNLGALVLLRHDDSGRQVRDAYSRVGGVYPLAPRARSAVDIDPKLLVFDGDVHVFCLREDRDGGGGGMDSSGRFGDRNALDPVHARLPTHGTKRALPHDFENDLLDTAERSVGVGHDVYAPPAVTLDEARVHAIEVCGEQGSLVASGAGTELDDGGAVVEWVVRYEQGLEIDLELRDRLLETRYLVPRFGCKLGFVNRNELTRLRELVFVFGQSARRFDYRSQPLMLPA